MGIKLRSHYSGGRPRIKTETLYQDKTLEFTDEEIQSLTNGTDKNLNLFLPDNPPKNTSFAIINQDGSLYDFLVNNRIIFPGDRYEIIFDGHNWIEL